MTSTCDNVVLVTGGGGCLGQHLIGLLQTCAPHVTEIRVLDIKPYENKLDYASAKPVIQFNGSVTDRELLAKACRGVASVFHLASIVDYSMFPDEKKMNFVNVEGTCALLEVCKEVGVKRFIYCSSMSVVLGLYNMIDGTESDTCHARVPLHNGYATSKQRAESMVINANSNDLKTVAIRPVTIYGEEDIVVFSKAFKLAKRFGGWHLIDCKGATHQMVYAGNVAWMFICAEIALRNGKVEETENHVDGEVYFAVDDTPCADSYEILAPFAQGCDIPVKKSKLPMWLLLVPLHVVYFILWMLSPIMKINISMGVAGLKQMLYSYSFKYDKAKSLLGYTPVFSYEESLERSVKFYKQYIQK